jgi:tRNA(fMet)-specific endonuclease VapC
MTPEFMLDTDAVSCALRGQGDVATRVLEHRPSQLCISSITRAELRYGADARGSKRLHALIDTVVQAVTVLPFDQAATDRFGSVGVALAKRGEPIGTFDTLIAAHATACGVTLVTNNTKHFQRVTGLKLANWI